MFCFVSLTLEVESAYLTTSLQAILLRQTDKLWPAKGGQGRRADCQSTIHLLKHASSTHFHRISCSLSPMLSNVESPSSGWSNKRQRVSGQLMRIQGVATCQLACLSPSGCFVFPSKDSHVGERGVCFRLSIHVAHILHLYTS